MSRRFFGKKVPQNSILSRSFPAVAALSFSVIGVIVVLGFGNTTLLGIASAQTGSNATTTGATNASKLMGVIGSMQLDENGNPAWITAGDWTINSDASLISSGASNETEPQISNFSATIYMVKNSDGRDFHQHRIYNFRQTAVTHQGANSTTVNGTFTITLLQGPVDNVNGYIHVINDKIELWVDPVASDNHFGPTTITGMVLDPERLSLAEKRFSEVIGQQGTTKTTTTTGSVQQ